MIARYSTGSPRKGSKKRDAKVVVAAIQAYQPDLIACLCVGWAGELEGLGDGPWRLAVADSDPAIRDYWCAANAGGLHAAATCARKLWETALEIVSEEDEVAAAKTLRKKKSPRPEEKARVFAAWTHLRKQSDRFVAAASHNLVLGAWAIAVGAGANRGGWRLNSKGEFNFPYSPGYDPEFLLRRIFGGKEWEENAKAADEFTRGRVESIGEDWREGVESAWAGLSAGRKVWLCADPPYGSVHGVALYDGGWSNAERDALAWNCRELVRVGAKSVFWCGANDLESWAAPDSKIAWTYRATKTLVKAARIKDDGSEEPARYGPGGYFGLAV